MSNLTMNWMNIHVGETIHNDNDDDYIVIAINPKDDRTLLLKKGTKEPYYVGAWALQECNYNPGSWYWCQGHYFMDNLSAAVDYVMNIKREE